jgi:hypothetical protein
MHANRNREWTRIDPPTQSDSTELVQVLRRDKQRKKKLTRRRKGKRNPGMAAKSRLPPSSRGPTTMEDKSPITPFSYVGQGHKRRKNRAANGREQDTPTADLRMAFG